MKFRLNAAQSGGISICIFLVLCIILLHYPFGSYHTSIRKVEKFGYGPCPDYSLITQEFLDKAGLKELAPISEQEKRCSDSYKTVKEPFTRWYSKDAVLPALASTRDTLIAILIIVLAGGLWVWLFRGRKTIA